MTRHYEKKIVPYSAKEMFDLVSDVKSYPKFLPWCIDSNVYDIDNLNMKADLIVGNNHFKEKFTSIIIMEKNKSIIVKYGGGALSHLTNEWHFKSLENEGKCEISFFVDFKLKSKILNIMMEIFFQNAFNKMMSAFVKRAKYLYGDK